MGSEQKFNAGDAVYVINGQTRQLTRGVVHRVTKTLAVVLVGSRDRKFSQRDGYQSPRPASSWSLPDRIECSTPELERKYAVQGRGEIARRLAFAAEQFHRGDTKQEPRIHELYAKWAELGKDTTHV